LSRCVRQSRTTRPLAAPRPDRARPHPATTPAPKRGRGRPAKEEVTPEHDADEVEELVRRVSREVGKPAAVKIIKSFKCDDLADLLSHPEHFDAAFDAATEALPADEDTGGDDDI
jgi:hypothetical protein